MRAELLRLELQAQRSGVLVLQLGQRLQRIVVAALVEQQLGLGHQAQVAVLRRTALHLLQIVVARLERPQLVGRARGNHETQAASLVLLQSLSGCPLGTSEAALEVSAQRLLERAPGPRLLLFATELRGTGRHCQRQGQCAYQQVGDDEPQREQHDGEVE